MCLLLNWGGQACRSVCNLLPRAESGDQLLLLPLIVLLLLLLRLLLPVLLLVLLTILLFSGLCRLPC
jgi:hypothetical protein